MIFNYPLAINGCIVFFSEPYQSDIICPSCVVVYNLSTETFLKIQIPRSVRKNGCKVTNFNNRIGVLTFDQRSNLEFDVFMSLFDVYTCNQESWFHLFTINRLELGYDPFFGYQHLLVLYVYSTSKTKGAGERTTLTIYLYNPTDDIMTSINRVVIDGQSWFNATGRFFYSMVDI